MIYSKSVGIDEIDVSKASSLLANDSKLSQKMNVNLAHAHNRQRGFFNKDFPQAMREFYPFSHASKPTAAPSVTSSSFF